MGPDAPAHEADGDAGEHHERVAEDRLAAEGRDDLRDDAEARQDDDVHLGVAEDPEEVLPQQRVGAGFGIEELRIECPVEQQQEQGHGDHRQGERQQELGDQQHPGEDRHAEQRHARRPHVQAGHDQVDRRHQRGDTGDQKTDGVEVNTVGRRVDDAAVGRVAEPAAVGPAATDQPRGVEEDRAREPHPEREGVEPGEGDVAGTDLERDQIVREGGGQRHDEEEHHGDAVHREDLVVEIGTEEALVGEGQLGADQQRLDPADDEEEHGGDAVHDPDLLVVDGADPVLPPTLGLGSGEHAERPLRVGLTAGEGAGFFGDRHGHSTSEAAMISSLGRGPSVSK